MELKVFGEKDDIVEWLTNSKHRALLVAVFNFAIRAMECIIQMSYIIQDGGIDIFIDQSWEYLATFFVLRILPILLGLLLLCAVTGNHSGGCIAWCIGEMFVIISYLLLWWFWSMDNSQVPQIRHVWDSNLMICAYCILRTISIVIIIEHIERLQTVEIYSQKVTQLFLRNQFWHQLSQIHTETVTTSVKEDRGKKSKAVKPLNNLILCLNA